MKLSLMLMMVFSIGASARGFAQKKISLSLNNKELEQVILQIEKQTNYRFLYKDNMEALRKKVSVNVKDASLNDVLSDLLLNSGLHYEFQNGELVVIMEDGYFSPVADTVVIGTVSDPAGAPLANVSVGIKDSKAGTSTDKDGRFSIAVPTGKNVLVFSFVGYSNEEVVLGSSKKINVTLKQGTNNLNDVVVVGYGTVKKKDLTGSVVSVTQAQITSTPVTNVLETLQGKVAGLDLTRSSGEAGAAMNFTLRGNRSLNASNTPLVLVDGVQYGSYIDINPNDIASIDVLKDASSTAIYGSRGANGVILITTKSGKGKMKVESNNYYGVNTLSGYDKPSGLDDYVAMTRESYRATGQWNSPADDATIFGANYPNIQKGVNTDWTDIIVRNGTVQSNHIALSAGNEKTTFRLSSEYFNEKGFLKNDQLKRFVQHLNLDHKILQNLKIGTVLNFNSSTRERRNTSFWNLAKLLPLGEPYNEDGSVKLNPFPSNLDINPLMDEDKENYANHTTSNRIFMLGYGEWGIVKGLQLRTSFGIDISNSQQGIFEGKNFTLRSTNNGFTHSSISDNNSRSWTWENVLSYNKVINDHSFSLMAGTSMISNRSVTLGAEGRNQPFPTALFYNLGTNTQDIKTSSSLVESKLGSGFGRLNYKFKDRYLLTASLRADGASVLADGNKWAYFPSVAVAWRLLDEPFLKFGPFFSELKLRGSFGISGNSAIQPYQTQGGLSRIPYAFDETPAIGYWPYAVANRTLGWEKTATTNVGLDFGLFKGRVNGTVDVYQTRTSNLLMQRILPSFTGFSSIIDNVGKTKTKGVDVTLSTTNFSTKNFTWQTDFNFATFKEEIVALSVGGDDVSKAWFVGKPINVFYDYYKTGIWQNGEKDAAAVYKKMPGEIKVEDINGDGVITAADDRKVLGQATPKWTAGMTNTLSYKNISLSVLIYARVGQMISSDYAGSYYPGGLFNVSKVDYWTPENPTNDYPRPKVNNNDQYLSSLRYVDGSFVKIKDIRLLYNITKNTIKKMPFSNIAVYATAKNFFTFSSIKNYDPERGGSLDYPLTKQLVFGLNVAL